MRLVNDQYRSLLSGLGLRLAFYKLYDIPWDELSLCKNEYGKPLAYFNGRPYHFNISHSAEWVIIAFANSPIGIDIEEIKEMNKDFSKIFFTVEESLAIESKQISEKSRFFMELWTMKESYVKYIGRGLSIPLSDFTFVPITNKDNTFKSMSITEDKKMEIGYVQKVEFDPDYALSICTQYPVMLPKVRIFSFEELVQQSNKIYLEKESGGGNS